MQWFDPDHDYVNEYIDTWNQKIRSAKTWMIALGAVLVLIPRMAALLMEAHRSRRLKHCELHPNARFLP